MLIKCTMILDIEPTESDEGDDDNETMFNCVNSFLECAKMQCEFGNTHCINAECEGCIESELLNVERVEHFCDED